MKIHSNRYYLAFMLILGLIVFGYTGTALWRWYGHIRLSAHVTAEKVDWSVIEKGSSSYVLDGKYHFTVNGAAYVGETIFYDDNHLNIWSAEQAVPRYAEKKWTVWYQPSDPHYSSLQKKFPLKECLSALVMWGLWIYFFWLGLYVSQKKGVQ
jgi:hypothetical protein